MAADLILANLSVQLGGRPVLKDVDATVAGGEFCCLLGPNGAGKTTLLRAVTGYMPVAGGRISLGRTRLDTLGSRERAKHVALVPQLAPPVGPLTVLEAVALGLLPRGTGPGRMNPEEKSLLAETLALLQLEHKSADRCDELSGGEWRKVLVAQGIVQQADVLLLDEPTAFLDPPARSAILAAARELCLNRGVTVIAVLHDPQLAESYADSALLLRDGRVVFHGPPQDATTEQRLDELYANGNELIGKGAER
jgi:iron complex transport system ATP-binding protein